MSAAVLSALFGQVGSVGAGYLGEVVTKALDRVRQAGAGEASPAQLREAIENELRAQIDEEDSAIGLRREVATLLRAIGGIDAAVSAAVEAGAEEVQSALDAAFTALSGSIAEFGWMVDETRQTLSRIQDEQARQGAEQRHQTDLVRETLVKTTLLLQRHNAATRTHPPAGQGQTTEPADLSEDSPAPGSCPYMGLRSFQAEDAQWFFGRERLTAVLVARLAEAPLLAVVGASGSGKSSLLRAGLLPAAWAGTVPGANSWTTVILTPTAYPLEELASRVALLCRIAAGSLLADLRTDPHNLQLVIRQVLADAPVGARLLLIIDQLEEIFTLCNDDTERQGFLDALAALVTDPRCGIAIVLGIRADFYPRCADYPPLAAALQDNQLLVTSMNAEELREAITRPAQRADLVLEAGLVETVLADLGEEPGSLPLLSHALSATWECRRGRTLTRDGYRAAGGVRQAIGQTADAVYARLTPTQQTIAKDIFLRLTALGEGTEDTRRRVQRTELLSGSQSPQVQDVLNALATARLITLDQDSIEVAHEALIREWPRLRRWLDEDREGLRLARGLTTAAHDWATLGRDEGALYRGARLADIRAWVQRAQPRLSEVENEFLTTSILTQEREEQATQRRTRRLRQLVGGLAIVLLLAVALAGIAITQQRTAVGQRDVALSRQVVGAALALRATNPALAAQLSLAAYHLAPIPEVRGSLLSTFGTFYATQLTGHTSDVYASRFSPDGRMLATASLDHTVRLWDVSDPHHPNPLAILADHTDGVTSAAFSPDGRILATAGGDRVARLWDLTDPHHPRAVATLTGHVQDIRAVTFSPDGRTLATGSFDNTVRLWDLTDSHHLDPLATFTAHANAINSVAFSPDGRTLVTAAYFENPVRLWDITDRRHPRPLPDLTGHTRAVLSVAFSADGRTLATGSFDNTVRLWDVADLHHPGLLATVTGHTDGVTAIAFSPDGHTLATSSYDHTARLWDITDPHNVSAPATLSGHAGTVYSVAFSPDGTTLATGSRDNTVRLWDLQGPVLTGHSGRVLSAAFSPDGHTLATGSYRTARLWTLTDPRHPHLMATLAGHTDYVFAVVFSPDERTLATASLDHTVRLWTLADPRHPELLATLAGHTDNVFAAAFSPDGRTLATASADHTVRLWNLTDLHQPSLLATLTGHTDAVFAVAFSPDGRTLVTGSADRSAQLWDVTDRRHPSAITTLTGHGNSVNSVVFSPDGHTIATGSADHTARLWDTTDRHHPSLLTTLTGHSNTVNSVAFNLDGHTLLTGSFDNTARLWDITDRRHPGPPATLTGHTDIVNSVAFSPDGHTIATGSDDATTRLWNTDIDRITKQICAITHPPITHAEWNQYFPDLAYQPPCQ